MIANEIDEFFFDDELAIPATYTIGGASSVINVIYENEYLASVLYDMEVENRTPTIRCRTVDVAGVDHGATFQISSEYLVTSEGFLVRTNEQYPVVVDVLFHVLEVQHDGTGVTLIRLTRD